DPAPFAMPLTTEAKGAWVAFYDRHRAEMADLDDDLAAAWSKLEAYAARLALIVQLCEWSIGDGSSELVDQASVEAGIALCDWFGQEARRVYSVLAERNEHREQRELIELVQRKGGAITVRELMRCSRQFPKADDAEAALSALAKAGFGHWEPVPAGPEGGKPTRVFSLSDPADADKTSVKPEEIRGFVNVDAHNDAINRLLTE